MKVGKQRDSAWGELGGKRDCIAIRHRCGGRKESNVKQNNGSNSWQMYCTVFGCCICIKQRSVGRSLDWLPNPYITSPTPEKEERSRGAG